MVAFDFAGSGKSGGEHVSLGYYERDDLKVGRHLGILKTKGETIRGDWCVFVLGDVYTVLRCRKANTIIDKGRPGQVF